MYKHYTVKHGIEFRLGVKEKILIIMIVAFLAAFILNFNKILEIIIAGL